jgi:molybdopterin-guanine dinucleotide biosynthesis protein A
MTEYAVVFAGGKATEPLAAVFKVRYKGEIVFDGERLVDRALRTVREAGGFERIFAVLPDELREPPLSVEVTVIPARAKLMDNFMAAMESTREADLTYLVGCDAPRTTAEMVNSIRRAVRGDPGKDIYYPVVEKRTIEAKYPGARRTYVTLKEGSFTGGNIIVVNGRRAMAAQSRIQSAVALRKKPLALVAKMGARFIWKALTGRLSLAEAVARVEALSGLRGMVVVCPCPEIAMDIDEPGDYDDLARAPR